MYNLHIVNEDNYENYGADAISFILRFDTLKELYLYIDATEEYKLFPLRYEIERVK